MRAAASRARLAPADKHDQRRNELAESALRTLGQRGYTRTSLREIASNSEFSHGVVHYYFAGKLELIVYCVQYYKARCVTRYDGVVTDSASAQGLLDAFSAKLAETIRDEGPMHCLWYDLRSESMFEPGLREAVTLIDRTLEQMIWRVVTRYAELAGLRPAQPGDGVRPAGRPVPAVTPRSRGRPARRSRRLDQAGARDHAAHASHLTSRPVTVACTEVLEAPR